MDAPGTSVVRRLAGLLCLIAAVSGADTTTTADAVTGGKSRYPRVVATGVDGRVDTVGIPQFIAENRPFVTQFRTYKALLLTHAPCEQPVVIRIVVAKDGTVDSADVVSADREDLARANAYVKSMFKWRFGPLTEAYDRIVLEYEFRSDTFDASATSWARPVAVAGSACEQSVERALKEVGKDPSVSRFGRQGFLCGLFLSEFGIGLTAVWSRMSPKPTSPRSSIAGSDSDCYNDAYRNALKRERVARAVSMSALGASAKPATALVVLGIIGGVLVSRR